MADNHMVTRQCRPRRGPGARASPDAAAASANGGGLHGLLGQEQGHRANILDAAGAVDTAKPRATLRMMGVCRGETVIERTMKILGVPTRARGLPRFTGVRRELILDVREGARVELANLIVERGRAFRGAGLRKAALPTSPSIVCA